MLCVGKKERKMVLNFSLAKFSCHFHVQFSKNFNLASRRDILVLLTFQASLKGQVYGSDMAMIFFKVDTTILVLF